MILGFFVQSRIVHMLEVIYGQRLRWRRCLLFRLRLFPISNDIDWFIVGVSVLVWHLDRWFGLGMAKAIA